MTCGCRALSVFEADPLFKGADWVAPKLLPRKLQMFVHIPFARTMLKHLLGPEGVYEWVIARTRYIDNAFMRVGTENFSQVLLFGAGFDSRGVRFQAELKDSIVFELDAPTTQKLKREQFRARGIEVPQNVKFVPINFESESVAEKLREFGFRKSRKTLVVLEGVLQYLKPEAVSDTFTTIRDHVGAGSRIVFDYAHASAVRGEGNEYGQDRMIKGVKRFGESWQFGLEENEVEVFLQKYQFALVDRKGPKELEELNFQGKDGVLRGKVNGTQSIVTAEALPGP